MKRLFFAILILCFTGSLVSAEDRPMVNAIEVRGLKRIEEGAIKAKITQKIGTPLSQEKTNEDIKTIFKMGYFEDVKIDIEAFEGGVRLVYIVKEKPTIIAIELQGNKELDDSKIREKMSVTPGAIADTVLIQDNAFAISSLYEEEGYWLTNVVPVVKKVSEADVRLIYQIDEGTKVKIHKIQFEGNENLSASKIKKVMETGEWWLFSFVTSTGYYKKSRMASDTEKIKHLYFDHGFIKVVIAEPVITVDKAKKTMDITIRISEGDQFRVSSIKFTGNTVYDNDTIFSKITLKPEMIFNRSVLHKDISEISSLYSNNGYALVSVTPDLLPDAATKTVGLSLRIEEGDRYRIGRIEVIGNTKTRDKVIRREIRIDEGEIFDQSKLKRSYERINNLNFFENVEMIPKPRPEEKVVDVDVKVKERQTGYMSLGGGYSTEDSWIGSVEVAQGNLFGRGQAIRLKGEFGGESTYYEASFKDPWFLDYPVALNTGIYKHLKEYDLYDKDAFGFYLGFSKQLTEFWRASITYNYEDATVNNIDEDASVVVKDQEGNYTTSSITPMLVRDSRDSYIDPTRGSRNAIYFTFAGLGGTNGFIKAAIDSAWFFPVGSSSFMVRGRFGYSQEIMDKHYPLYERFYVGGIQTVRGLDYGEAGPKDPNTDDPIGGTEEIIFNFEYIFPIFADAKLKGVVFFDAGHGTLKFVDFLDLRYTTGAGLRWISPFGPVRIEWGYNLKQHEGESSNKLEFSFGSFF